jgi:predicted phosphodiesterase
MRFITLIVLILLLIINSRSYANRYTHFVCWGDEEGTIKRPEKGKSIDLNLKNKAIPIIKKRLEEIESSNPIDAILHVGDFVRFDPDESYYKDFLGEKFLSKFYPTSGGDQEFYQGKYVSFLRSVPHLKFLYLNRVQEDKNPLEYYYHTIIKNVHIISLYSPDEFREHNKYPEYYHVNVYENKNSLQYIWLEKLLKNIRVYSEDKRPIIVLTHGPVFNMSYILVSLFEKYKVNLVLSGDFHVLAHKSYKNTQYFVSGMSGDTVLGECESLNSKENKYYLSNYDFCIPEKQILRTKESDYKFYNDHYLDILINENELIIKAIDLEKGNEIYMLKK